MENRNNVKKKLKASEVHHIKATLAHQLADAIGLFKNTKWTLQEVQEALTTSRHRISHPGLGDTMNYQIIVDALEHYIKTGKDYSDETNESE